MRIMLDSTCPRCGAKTSYLGVTKDVAKDIPHICADGVLTPATEQDFSWRLVPGPGERTKLPEEKGYQF